MRHLLKNLIGAIWLVIGLGLLMEALTLPHNRWYSLAFAVALTVWLGLAAADRDRERATGARG